MAEAAGFVLAVIPICVSVVEKYAVVAKVIHRFRKYDEQAKSLSQAINIYNSIYRNSIRILLCSVASEDEVQQMICDPAHYLWNDATLEQQISKRLGDSLTAFADATSAIEEKLSKLEQLVRDWQVMANESKSNPSNKLLKRSTREKIKFAFSEPEIENLVSTISRLSQDLRLILQQAEAPYERKSLSVANQATKWKIEKLRTIKTAAGNLYKALGHACTMHVEHNAHLSLQPVCNDSSQVQFTLALRHTSMQVADCPTLSQSRLWLTVESSISGTLESKDKSSVIQNLQYSLKRPLDEHASSSAGPKHSLAPEVKRVMPKKQVQIIEPHTSLPATLPKTCFDVLPNFCTNENFCTQLQRVAKQTENHPTSCVGYLELAGCSKHLVYLNAKSQSVVTTTSLDPLIKLNDLFSSSYRSKLPCAGLLQHDRIAIAKQLALAVLQFQATPWLEKSWNSQEVLMSGLGPTLDLSKPKIAEPYLNVSIKGPNGPPVRSDTWPSRTLIRNRLLFNLGVIMLELAFQQPLADLRKPEDADHHEDKNTDYYTADRIRRQASAHLGPRYAEVARKCIQCDFGHGDDLNETRLQEGFYQDVICELEVLENRFRDFNLSI